MKAFPLLPRLISRVPDHCIERCCTYCSDGETTRRRPVWGFPSAYSPLWRSAYRV